MTLAPSPACSDERHDACRPLEYACDCDCHTLLSEASASGSSVPSPPDATGRPAPASDADAGLHGLTEEPETNAAGDGAFEDAMDAAAHRFWPKVEVNSLGCWLWTGCRCSSGYALFGVAGKKERGHRVAYRLLVGPIPAGLCLDHLCRVRHCVNPTHLEPVTHRENCLRGRSPAILVFHSDACAAGHPRTPENTKVQRSNGRRECRDCINERNRLRKAQQRASSPREFGAADGAAQSAVETRSGSARPDGAEKRLTSRLSQAS